MTTTETIDGVLRELLDAPAAEADPIVGVLKRCLSEGVQPTFSGGDLKHLIRLLESKPAAQPQGEPVAWIKADVAKTLTKDECCYAFGSQNPKGTLIPLYAEQPAPVAVVPDILPGLEYAWKHFDGLSTSQLITLRALINKAKGIQGTEADANGKARDV